MGENNKPSKKKIEEIRKAIESKDLNLDNIARGMKMAPSKRKVYQMPKDILLKHNALVFHKGSSLSSTQRRLVQTRVAYGLNNGTIKTEEVALEINKLNALIQGELVKAIKEKEDGNSTN